MCNIVIDKDVAEHVFESEAVKQRAIFGGPGFAILSFLSAVLERSSPSRLRFAAPRTARL